VLLQIEHVQLAMPSGQEAAARDFYSDILGLAEVPKPENLAKRGGCWFESSGVKVHLGVQENFLPARKAHPAFLVKNLTELRMTLEQANFKCVEDEPLQGYTRFYVSDPFGNRIELMERN
jgi:catechol 2,3-dioxygenase-like lactoylglutathione lyase family enzyme